MGWDLMQQTGPAEHVREILENIPDSDQALEHPLDESEIYAAAGLTYVHSQGVS